MFWKDSAGSYFKLNWSFLCILTKVSSGNPTSARERRRQRERESMGKAQSVLPSSLSSEKISSSPISSDTKGLLYCYVIW